MNSSANSVTVSDQKESCETAIIKSLKFLNDGNDWGVDIAIVNVEKSRISRSKELDF